MQNQRLLALGYAWCFCQAKQLLQPHCEDWRMLRVVDTDVRAGRHLDRLRRLDFQFLWKRPRQEISDYRRQIKLTEEFMSEEEYSLLDSDFGIFCQAQAFNSWTL